MKLLQNVVPVVLLLCQMSSVLCEPNVAYMAVPLKECNQKDGCPNIKRLVTESTKRRCEGAAGDEDDDETISGITHLVKKYANRLSSNLNLNWAKRYFVVDMPSSERGGEFDDRDCGRSELTEEELFQMILQEITDALKNSSNRMKVIENETALLKEKAEELKKETASMKEQLIFESCRDAREKGHTLSGVYDLLVPFHNNFTKMKVFCDQDTDDGGWIVIQRRVDGSINFERNWIDYVTGFGNVHGEYWLGLDNIHKLTSIHKYELRVDLVDWEYNRAYAKYRDFCVGSYMTLYKLFIGSYEGNAGDALSYQNGMSFSTFDQDNDNARDENCSKKYKGGWWYNWCHHCNLNGKYYPEGRCTPLGVSWREWKERHYSNKAVTMMIRRKKPPTGFKFF